MIEKMEISQLLKSPHIFGNNVSPCPRCQWRHYSEFDCEQARFWWNFHGYTGMSMDEYEKREELRAKTVMKSPEDFISGKCDHSWEDLYVKTPISEQFITSTFCLCSKCGSVAKVKEVMIKKYSILRTNDE